MRKLEVVNSSTSLNHLKKNKAFLTEKRATWELKTDGKYCFAVSVAYNYGTDTKCSSMFID